MTDLPRPSELGPEATMEDLVRAARAHGLELPYRVSLPEDIENDRLVHGTDSGVNYEALPAADVAANHFCTYRAYARRWAHAAPPPQHDRPGARAPSLRRARRGHEVADATRLGASRRDPLPPERT